MPKPNRRKSPKNATNNDKADEGLELISIGNLYSGPWDKKYWSSSRGKDRYPFPVGYKAVRAYNGSTYKVEISEGPAGPLFMINSADGQAFSGQTADIVWESCQKKSCPRLKIWHGKRFSPKIDGVEFFGFKNPFVQRLLRELVANINGINEGCSSPSSSCSGLCGAKNKESPEHRSYPDLIAYLARPSATGKRSRRNESRKKGSFKEACVKKCKPQDLSDEGSPPKFVCLSGHFKERDDSAQKVRKHAGLTNGNSSQVPNLCAEENLLDRSPDAISTGFDFGVASEDQSRSALSPKDSAGANDFSLYAPDTLDVTQLDKVISEGFIAETHLQENQNISSSNASSQKSDFNLIDQEMARSMMTLLLPQAVPLLKEAPRKEKNTPSSKTCSYMEAQEKKGESDVAGQIGKVTHIKGGDTGSVISCCDCSKCLVPDSFEDDQCDDHPTIPSVPCSHIAEAVRSTSDEGTFPQNRLTRANGSSISHTHTSRGKHDADPGELEFSVHISEKAGNARSAIVETGKAATQVEKVVYSRRKHRKARVCNGPKPDIMIARNKKDDCVLERGPSGTEIPPSASKKQSTTELSFPEGSLEEQCIDLHKEVKAISSGYVSDMKASVTSEDQACIYTSEDGVQQNGHDSSLPLIESAQGCISSNIKEENVINTYFSSRNQLNIENKPYNTAGDQVGIDMESHHDMELRHELEKPFRLLGRYIHPMPVLSLSLITEGQEIYVGVLCGNVKDNIRMLFIYKVAIDERIGSPAFLGHTCLMLPSLRDNEGRIVATERSGLQFTPDGQFFVLLDSIKAPHCREQDINCECSTCVSTSFTENAVKVVKVDFGYISVVKKLKANNCLHCLLVCGPDHLIAVGESGRLHVWVMNITWSAQKEEFILPAHDCNSPGIVEVMKIPKSVVLVLGYDGFGEFSLWNISSRICLSKFSAAKTSICQFFPVGLFSWNRVHPPFGCDVKEHINRVLPVIIQQSDNYDCHPSEGKDIAIWILVSTAPNSDAHKHIPRSSNTIPGGRWKLALLVKDAIIMGSALDPRAASVGISCGHGVIGTCDGLAYIWEMSTGARLGSLLQFRGSSVSCIAADETGSEFLAVASDGGHLLVYKHS